VIRKHGGKYCVHSRKSGRNLGCSRTKAGARKRERQIQYFKHRGGNRREVHVRDHRRRAPERPHASEFARRDPILADDWRDQYVIVDGQPRRLGDVRGGKLYHGSPARLSVGDVIEPGHGTRFGVSPFNEVSMTSEFDRAAFWGRPRTIWKDPSGRVKTLTYVYEVEPIGPVATWRASQADFGQSFVLYEARAPAARIVAVHEVMV